MTGNGPTGGSESGRAGRARFRALVVDDEEPLVRIVASYLEREGFEVLTAGDGRAGRRARPA
jgi:CheY-like chemotaxis protein